MRGSAGLDKLDLPATVCKSRLILSPEQKFHNHFGSKIPGRAPAYSGRDGRELIKAVDAKIR